jgi:integrin alpha FG-GAP repeat containing protein 1
LHVGASLHMDHTTTLESLIPNTQVIITPPEAVVGDDQPSAREWRSELFLHPGDWIPWVGAAVVGTVVVLALVVVWLNEKEKVCHAAEGILIELMLYSEKTN